MKKKSLLIVLPYFRMGGVEVSLLRLLKKIDHSRIETTILLAEEEGSLLEKIPSDYTIKTMTFDNEMSKLLVAYAFVGKSILQKVMSKLFRIWLKSFGRFFYKENPIYDYCLKHVQFDHDDQVYDLAIDYHGYGFFTSAVTSRLVRARRKVMWVHDEKIDFIQWISPYLEDYDQLYGVSTNVVNKFKAEYPAIKIPIQLFTNILDIEEILIKANESIDVRKVEGVPILVTVGRLSEEKGQRVALEAADLLHKAGYRFKWIFVGEGPDKRYLEEQILLLGLEGLVVLQGLQLNPYPYMRIADIYVQPSLHEGYGITIAEAKILSRPIIASHIPCIVEQFIDSDSAIFVEIGNSLSLCHALMDLIDNPATRVAMSEKLNHTTYSCEREIGLFHSQIL